MYNVWLNMLSLWIKYVCHNFNFTKNTNLLTISLEKYEKRIWCKTSIEKIKMESKSKFPICENDISKKTISTN